MLDNQSSIIIIYINIYIKVLWIIRTAQGLSGASVGTGPVMRIFLRTNDIVEYGGLLCLKSF